MLSDCCTAEIIPGKADNFYNPDKCGKCLKGISYALMDREWAQHQACGVFEKHDGSLWFFWTQVSQWACVESRKDDYLGQVKGVIDTIGYRYNTQDTDFISYARHYHFMKEYKPMVKNPDIADLLI